MLDFVFKKNKDKKNSDIVKEIIVVVLMFIFLVLAVFLWVYSSKESRLDKADYYENLSDRVYSTVNDIKSEVKTLEDQYSSSTTNKEVK